MEAALVGGLFHFLIINVDLKRERVFEFADLQSASGRARRYEI
jgi:hypothetical protein